MAEAMIEVALETLSSLILKELVSCLGVNREMRRLSSILTTIKAVLEDAEEKQITDKALKNWLRKLRDAAYLLDDILDEYSTHALSLEYQHKVQGSCLYSFNPIHVMFRYKMAKKLKDIGERLDEIAEERLKFHLRQTVHERRNQVMEWRQTTSIITQPQFYGRAVDKEKIVDFLVGDASNLEDVSVYPITGIGGLGKTTLAQQVFNDERVIHHFELRIWVCVSEDFNMKRLSKAIIESATGHACSDLDLEPLQRRLQEVVGRKRYLLVLDDMWNDNQEKWDKLKYSLACGSRGSSILVTTRLTQVACITGTRPPHQLSLLSEDDCWELFRQRAFGLEMEERVELVAIGKEIVKKCKGVPLAAKTLGSLLRFQSDEKDWLHIKESEIWNLPQEEDSILPALRLSYLNLSTKVRQCFGYLAVFPKDHIMSKKHVIELWMANGFISTNEGCEVEDVGDRVWKELYLRSFFEDVENRGWAQDTCFKMHDLIHDLAQFVMEEECCSSTFTNSSHGERTRHLSFLVDGPLHKGWSSHLDKVKLKTSIILLGYGGAHAYNDIMLKCSHLRALDLRFSKELQSSIGRLRYLRYLNLSGGSFKALPNSICRLYNLQNLNLNGCGNLAKLPNQMKCLKSLRHLCLDRCASLSRLFPDIGQLASLKTLHKYIVGTQKGFLLAELRNLKLEGALHIRHLERVRSVMGAKEANLADKHLMELVLSWERNEESQAEENDDHIVEVLQPHSQLKILLIGGYLGSQLPQWMCNSTLKYLSELELVDCKNCFHISPLEKLPSLTRLGLSNMDLLQYVDNESYDNGVARGFNNLEFLLLEKLPNLLKLSRADGGNIFPCLSTLQITHCPKLILPCLPSVTEVKMLKESNGALLGSIQNLHNLECLWFIKDKDLISFPNGMLGGLACLKELHIYVLEKLEVLPTELSNLNALEELQISGCENLETLAEQAFQGLYSLKRLTINRYPKFKLSAGFRYLTALEDLTIEGCPEVEHLPEALQHAMALQSLGLYDLPNLAFLPDWLGNLRLLKSLVISNCPRLMSLPMSIQCLSSLKVLKIYGCPELVKRCKKGTGEDWPKISHVSRIDLKERGNLACEGNKFSYFLVHYRETLGQFDFML